MENEKSEAKPLQKSEWNNGKIKKYTKGGSAIWFEGQGTEDNPIWTPVKPTLQKIVTSAGWGAEIKWKGGTFFENGGNKKGLIALEIIKKGTTLTKQSNGATSIHISRMKAIDLAIETLKLTGTFKGADDTITTKDILAVAQEYVQFITGDSND